jgi:hypothetical protein
MKKEKSARIVKGYSIVLGWLLLSPILLIPGYMLSKRIDEKRASVGPMIALAIVFGFFTLIAIAMNIFIFIADSELWGMCVFVLVFDYLIFGIPFQHSIRYLLEEKKNPTKLFEPVDQRISKLKQLLDEGVISQDDFDNRKNSILEEI